MQLRSLTSGVLAVALTTGTVVSLPATVAAQPTTGDIVINEIESNGDPAGDWVELANTNSEQEIDVSGWELIDDDPTHDPLVIPDGTTIESGGYISFVTDQNPDLFGLGSNDSVILSLPDGTVVDETTWSGHSPTSWGRVPDMTGEFAVTGESTRDAANIPQGDVEPVETDPWPHDPLTVNPAGLGGDFAEEDMSGVDFAPDGTAYVVNNGLGTLYALDYDQTGGTYSIARSFELTYPEGSGLPDAEGVTVGPGGAIYVATERNDDDGGTSRPSVLRYELPADGSSGELVATDEYNLTPITGELAANGGLEAIEYLPEAMGGVFAVGVEQTGNVHFVQLGDQGEATEMQTFESPFQGVMALDYEETTGILRVVCDEVCEGRSLEMTFDGEQFVTDGTLYARSASLENNAYEGYASITESVECSDGGTAEQARYLWTDDAVTDGAGLRGAVDAGDCSGGGLGGSLEGSSLTGSLGSGSLAGEGGLFGSATQFGFNTESSGALAPLPAL